MEPRILDPEPLRTLDEYVRRGGGRGLDAARRLGPAGTIDDVEASGLRGRGGAGFPTGRKWRTVLESLTPASPPTVVVNAAEGEPGSFKDRAILLRNPYLVLEGALVAAAALGADGIVVAAKASFRREIERVGAAIEEVRAAGWAEGAELFVVEGPSEYLYGEETALLEVIAGRPPFPRVAPPFRHGVDEVGTAVATAASGITMAVEEGETMVPPTLVNNVETFANVARIVAEGPDWYRACGTDESPGSLVCTISGHTRRHGVGEVPMGTPLSEVIETIGGGPRRGRELVAVMSGVANPLVPASLLDTPLSHEAMQAIGSGLGTGGFIVFDDSTDLVAVAHGVSRFLAVESCGQCTPCKQDGLALAELFGRLLRSEPEEGDLDEIRDRAVTVSERARCYLAHQHERVIASILRLFSDHLEAHATGRAGPAEPEPILPITAIVDGRALLDEGQLRKQPDWTFDEAYSGKAPADRVDHRSVEPL
jgi:NADH-quinone oxidoreductase subunit F